MLKWAIDFLDGSGTYKQTDFDKDQLVLYVGLYGVPANLIWACAPNPSRAFTTVLGTYFKLLVYSEQSTIKYVNTFVITSFYFDPIISMYRIRAIDSTYYYLSHRNLIEYKDLVSGDTSISGIQLLRKLFEKISKFPILKNFDRKDAIDYNALSFDPETTLLDVVSKVCNDNQWEWYLGPDALYIDLILVLPNVYLSLTEMPPESYKHAQDDFFITQAEEAYNFEPMAIIGKQEGRVIWSKVYLGSHGTHCSSFGARKSKDGWFHVSEKIFLETLPEAERMYALESKPREQNEVLVGKIFGSFVPNEKYEAPWFRGDPQNYSKFLSEMTFKKDEPYNFLKVKNAKMTTPYAGNGVGMVLPQGDSYRVLFSPQGERDLSLVGPAYFGPKDEIPKVASEKDFRLQLPDNTVIYNKNNNGLKIVSPNEIEISLGQMLPSASSPTAAAPYIKLTSDKTIIVSGPNLPQIEITATGIKITSANMQGIEITDSSLTIDNPSEVKVNNTTFKVGLGQIQMLGSVKLTGRFEATDIALPGVPSLLASLGAKLKPGLP